MDGLEVLLTMSFFLPLGLVAAANLALQRGLGLDFPPPRDPAGWAAREASPQLECCAPATELPLAA